MRNRRFKMRKALFLSNSTVSNAFLVTNMKKMNRRKGVMEMTPEGIHPASSLKESRPPLS